MNSNVDQPDDVERRISISKELSNFQTKLSMSEEQLKHLEDLFDNSSEYTSQEVKSRISDTIATIIDLEAEYNRKIHRLQESIEALQRPPPPEDSKEKASS